MRLLFVGSLQCVSIPVTMSVFRSNCRVFGLLACLMVFVSVSVSVPVQDPVEVQPDALINDVTLDRVDSLGYDPWSPLREKPAVRMDDLIATSTQATTSSDDHSGLEEDKNVDPLSLVYYIGSFAALLLFFLVVSCSECCCEKSSSNSSRNANNGPSDDCLPPDAGTPPPPYDDFAPPDYNSLFVGDQENKDKISVFVVPVHNPLHTPS